MPMPHDAIDLRTVLLLTTFVSMTTATAMVFLWRSHPGENSLPTWALGALLVAVGYLGISLRGWVSPFVSIPLANACITTGHAFFLNGVARMTGRKPLSLPALALLGLTIAATLAYFTYQQNSTAMRMLIQFLAIGMLSVTTALRLLATGEPADRLPRRAVAAIFLLFGLTLLIRVGLMAVDPPANNLFAPSATHEVVFVVMLLFYAALMYCFPALLFAKENAVRMMTERTLRANTDSLNEAQRIAHVGSWTLDLKSDTLTWSDEIFRLFEIDRDKFGATYEAFLNAIHPEDRDAVNRAYTESLANRMPYEITHRLLLSDGRIKWVHERCTSDFDAAGKPLRSVGTVQDVTAAKRAELEILKTNNQLQTLLDAIPDLLFEVDLDGRYYDYHSHRTDLLAAPPEVLLGKTVDEVLPPEAAAICHAALQEALEKGVSCGREICLPLAQGARWFELSIAAKPEGHDPERRFIVLSRDVTARKLAEAELRISAAAFNSQESIMVTDANRAILRVNRAFIENTGFTADEVIGQTPSILKSGRHSEDFYRQMWETIDSAGAWQGEIWDRRKNGEVYPKWLTISAVKDEHGVVTHYVGTHYDISERKKAEEKINDLAFFDQLTGLPNRTLLQDRMKQAMAASSRSGNYGALLFIDLDNFKTLNDTLGHDMGDILLKEVAKRLRLCVREGDTVARLGGDEFVVLLAGLGAIEGDAAIDIEAIGEKLLTNLTKPYQLGNLSHHSSASIGVTLYKGDSVTSDEMMKQADLAMYKAKEAGRNAWRFFDAKMESAVKERAALEDDLRHAIAEKQFLLHYQAQVASERILTGVEALVRWQHPQRGLVAPAEFIPLAEDTGLILPLGQWVLETACMQLAAWGARPEMAHLTVAVNVSARQFRQPDFVDQVLAALENTGADPQRLKLELTESLLVENIQEVIEKMSALKAKGVGFSLDDFGTGYSSLTYLKRLPLDQLKIDKSFVCDVLTDPNDAAIARTVVALAQSLGLGVIAEGVETETQRNFLANSGCHAYQGYFFSRPLPLEAFELFARQPGVLPKAI